MVINGTRRKIWDEDLINNFYKNSKEIIQSFEDKEYFDNLVKQFKGDFKLDHGLTCKNKSWLWFVIECKKCGYRAYRSKYQIIKKQHECYGCCVENIRQKCESKNYNLLDYLPFSDKSLISCKSCGDTFEVLKSAILGRNNIDCESCRIILYKRRCEEKSSEYISHKRVTNGILVKIKCTKCGYVDERYSSSIISTRDSSFKCQGCQDNRYEKNLENSKFSFVRYVDDWNCEVSCKIHKNVLRISRTTIRKGLPGFECPECILDKIKTRLEAKSCKYISHTSNKTTYLGIDGTIFTRSNGTIYSGRFAVSNNHRRNQPYKLYCISVNYMGNDFIKIGIATDPHVRLKSLGIYTKHNLHVLKEFKTGSEAQTVEYGLFKYFRKFRICTTISETFCSGITRNKVDGATEWLDASVLSENFYEVLDGLCCNTRRYS